MTTPKPVPDDLLAILVNVLNRFTERPDDRETEGIGITLTVGGAVITGQMISNTAWLDDMDQKIQDAGGGPWATVFSAKAERLRAQLGEASAAEQAVEDLADRFAAAVYQECTGVDPGLRRRDTRQRYLLAGPPYRGVRVGVRSTECR